jgi:DNA-binding transcriptional regulator LsrR (DeoR family)
MPRDVPVTSSLTGRLIGLSLEELLRVPIRIALAGGRNKEQALAGALAGGYATVLVTDERTARALLAGDDSAEGRHRVVHQGAVAGHCP